MISQVEGDIVAGCSRSNDDSLLFKIFLRSLVLKGVDDLSPEFFLKATTNQSSLLEYEEAWQGMTCFGNFGMLHDPAPSPKAKTR